MITRAVPAYYDEASAQLAEQWFFVRDNEPSAAFEKECHQVPNALPPIVPPLLSPPQAAQLNITQDVDAVLGTEETQKAIWAQIAGDWASVVGAHEFDEDEMPPTSPAAPGGHTRPRSE